MIASSKKAFEEILRMLEGYERVFVIGCGDCATQCQTGGEVEVEEMKQQLEAAGKTVTGTAVPDVTCNVLDTARVLRQQKEAVEEADAFLVLSCGTGVQSVADSQESKPVFPGVNSLFSAITKRKGQVYERCVCCSDCVVGDYAGICPMARCPKGQLHGPCGGYDDGKCEVNPEQDCVWALIFERATKTGQLEQVLEHMGSQGAKNWQADTHPGELVFEPRRAGKL
ncbi:MAG: methylenetetrahydrofolate reductase C-terminal domain-containing protein [Armatimonadetes bacterium]|nr:methylenetetrahydrofolate reductase C-terminal domain-containing protein [Armatimonadota bacterium]